jgi:Protein of unknown function (DUF3800)
MVRRAVFVDEAGNFDFSRSPGASRYFILASVTLKSYAPGNALMELRRELAWEGIELGGQFRATEERQAVRDRAFAVLADHDFRIDATIIDKAKTPPHLRPDNARFYKSAWYLHLQYAASAIASENDELLVVAASVGTHREQAVFRQAMEDAVRASAPCPVVRTAFWSAASEPCLEIADYCSWAIQRKWERYDLRSYRLIASKIGSEYDAMRESDTLYY